MKKVLLLVVVIISIYGVAHATTGACSYHGGVNCGMKNYDGSAICNDGWISSTKYYDTDECVATPKQCNYPVQPYCSLSDIQQQKQNALDQARLMDIRTPEMYPAHQTEIESTYSLKYSACQSQLTAYQDEMTLYNLCLNSQTQTPDVTIVPPSPQSCGPNATPATDGTCSCQAGYKKLGDQCVTLAEYCPSMSGPGAIPASNGNGFAPWDNECTCAPGYNQTEYILARCVPIVRTKETAPTSGFASVFATTTKATPLPVRKPRISTTSNIFSTSTTQSITASSIPVIASTTTPTPHESFIGSIFRSVGDWFKNIF